MRNVPGGWPDEQKYGNILSEVVSSTLTLALVLGFAPPADAGTGVASAPPPATPPPAAPATPPTAAPPAASPSPPAATPPAATPPAAAPPGGTPPAATPPAAQPPAGSSPTPPAGAAPTPAPQPPAAQPPAPPARAPTPTIGDPFKTPDQPAAPLQKPRTTPLRTPPEEDPSLRNPFDAGVETRQETHVTIVHSSPPPPPPPAPAPRQQQKKLFFSGYGGLSVRLSSVSKKLGSFVGVRGGLLIGDRVAIGGALYKLTRRFGKPIRDVNGNKLALKMAYGGLTMGVTVFRRGPMELALNGLAGAGVACISQDLDYDNDDYRCLESVKMFVGEPEAAMYVRVTDWMRVALTGGYRVVVRQRWSSGSDFMLSGGYGGLNLEFGWFKRD